MGRKISNTKRRLADLDPVSLNSALDRHGITFRRSHGLVIENIKERDCLRCEARFISYGRGNRMCSNCISTAENYKNTMPVTFGY